MIDPYLITTGIAVACLAVSEARYRRAKSDALFLEAVLNSMNSRYADQAKKLAAVVMRVDAGQAQRVAASKRAAEVNKRRAAERHSARVETTTQDLRAATFRPREEVVAGIRETRKANRFSAGVAAKKGG